MRETILESMARTLWVTAYADARDEGRINGPSAGPGEDWFDVAPSMGPAWQRSANALAGDMLEAFIHMNAPYELEALVRAWHASCPGLRLDGPDAVAERFGHYLAMQSLGHGVGLNDDGRPGGPRWRAGLFSGLPL